MKMGAIALAIPLALGIGCKSTQSSKTGTASSEQPGRSSEATASTSGQSSQAQGSTSSQPSQQPGATGSEAQASQGSQPSTGSSQDTASSQGSASSMGSQPGQAGSSDTTGSGSLAQGDVRGHNDDEVVSGTVRRASEKMLLIHTNEGREQQLQLAPQTTITVDGRDAQASEIQQGQDVRASFSTDNVGNMTAVKVEVLSTGGTSGMGSGSSGSSGSGSSGYGGSGSSGSGSSGTTSPGGSSPHGDPGSQPPPPGSGRGY
jgi:colicin import membrane protein